MPISIDRLRTYPPFEALSTMATNEIKTMCEAPFRVEHKKWIEKSAEVVREIVRLSNQNRGNEAEALHAAHDRQKPRRKTLVKPTPRPAQMHTALVIALVEYALEHVNSPADQRAIIKRFVAQLQLGK